MTKEPPDKRTNKTSASKRSSGSPRESKVVKSGSSKSAIKSQSPQKRGKEVSPARKRKPTETKRVTAKSRKLEPRESRMLNSVPATLSELDLYLFGEGRHELIYEKLGAQPVKHDGVPGVSFAVWAPGAEQVSVVGNFNSWDGAQHPMRSLGDSGVWETFIPKLSSGELYKYEIKTPGHASFLKADPYAFYAEVPPSTSSIVYESKYTFRDSRWLKKRAGREHFRGPLSIYEVHLGSWRRKVEEGNRPLTYREMAESLAEYVLETGFTHVEFLPLKEHPYGPSWGY